jgi:hypothetical protein
MYASSAIGELSYLSPTGYIRRGDLVWFEVGSGVRMYARVDTMYERIGSDEAERRNVEEGEAVCGLKLLVTGGYLGHTPLEGLNKVPDSDVEDIEWRLLGKLPGDDADWD